MTSKKIFLNICFAIIAFSIFLLLFLKPKFGPQFEQIKPAEKDKKVEVKSSPVISPSVTIIPTGK